MKTDSDDQILETYVNVLRNEKHPFHLHDRMAMQIFTNDDLEQAEKNELDRAMRLLFAQGLIEPDPAIAHSKNYVKTPFYALVIQYGGWKKYQEKIKSERHLVKASIRNGYIAILISLTTAFVIILQYRLAKESAARALSGQSKLEYLERKVDSMSRFQHAPTILIQLDSLAKSQKKKKVSVSYSRD